MEGEERVPMPERKHNFITWLDNCDATYWSDSLNAETGMRRFEFKPTDWMRWKHQIQEHEYDPNTGRIVKEYPDELCLNESTSANSIRWFIFCDYNKNDTNALTKLNKDLINKVRMLKRDLEQYKIAWRNSQNEFYKREAFRIEAEAKTYDKLKKLKKIIGQDFSEEDQS